MHKLGPWELHDNFAEPLFRTEHITRILGITKEAVSFSTQGGMIICSADELSFAPDLIEHGSDG